MKTFALLPSCSVATFAFGFVFAASALAADPVQKKESDPRLNKPAAGQPKTASPAPIPTSYMPVVPKEDFKTVMERMKSEKAAIEKKHADLLAERYDLSDKPTPGVTMSRSKPVQQGVRAKLPGGVTWQSLAEMTPEQIREKNAWPAGFLPFPTRTIPKAACFSRSFILRKQRNRNSAISPASISISICLIICCQSSPLRFS